MKSNHKSHFNFKMKFKGKCATGIKQFQSSHANTQHNLMMWVTFSDMQLGFRKRCGCSHAIFLLREVIDYFASHGSTVCVKLFNLLLDNNVFSSVISVRSLSVCLSVFSILCWLP